MGNWLTGIKPPKRKPESERGKDPRKADPTPPQSFDDDTLTLMRYQLKEDPEAFLLNNILMSVQFFENYERDLEDIKKNPISERERTINEAMARYNKHILIADRTQEYVNEYVGYQKTSDSEVESLAAPRLFVIYDNVDTLGRGDDMPENVHNVPFYKLGIEDCNIPGYISLKKLEVFERKLSKATNSNDSAQSDTEHDSSDSETTDIKEKLYEEIKKQTNKQISQRTVEINNITINKEIVPTGRRASGPIRIFNTQVNNSNLTKIKELKRINNMLHEEKSDEVLSGNTDNTIAKEKTNVPSKSILKISKPKDSETNGYHTETKHHQNEDSESDSDYGYTTITQAATLKNIVMMNLSQNSLLCYGMLTNKTWNLVEDESDTGDKEFNDYLNSIEFMNNFLDSFSYKLGSVLGLSQHAIQSSKTQGASIYYSVSQTNKIIWQEVLPALNATWPKAAKNWYERKRKLIKNPRTNFEYQWPNDDMIKKAKGLGCSLIPIGYRPKRGVNKNQKMQWKITFPAAERYLESYLAHAHIRCYLFTLTLYKTFLENGTSKVGIDASHIKNHLYWQCEDNYAKWPEHRLGEALLDFLGSFYSHCSRGCFPNYFMVKCDDFECIPSPLLMTQQHILHKILETPVMHVLYALNKLKYNKEEFYPKLNVNKLYNILTAENLLQFINPTLSFEKKNGLDAGKTGQGNQVVTLRNITTAKNDKTYLRKKKKYQKIQNEKRKGQLATIIETTIKKEETMVNTNIIVPKKMDPVRLRLILEFFISHFISMANTSQKFDAIGQAIIYLEQARRLCILLKDVKEHQSIGDDFLKTINNELVVCQKKLINQVGYNRPLGRDSSADGIPPEVPPRLDHYSRENSSIDADRLTITVAQVHSKSLSNHDRIKFIEFDEGDEDSKL